MSGVENAAWALEPRLLYFASFQYPGPPRPSFYTPHHQNRRLVSECLFVDQWINSIDPQPSLLTFGACFYDMNASAGMIPVETAGRQLDDDSWDRKEPDVFKTAETIGRRDNAETYSDASPSNL